MGATKYDLHLANHLPQTAGPSDSRADLVTAICIRRWHPGFLLLQNFDDLLLAEPGPLHIVRLLEGAELCSSLEEI